MLWTDFERSGRQVDPWRELERISRSLARAGAPSEREFPAANLWVASEGATATMEIAGMDAKDIDISVAGKSITVQASRRPEETKEDEQFHRRERWYGRFSRSLELPFNVDADKVKARYVNGVLSLDLPRAEAERPRKIEIKSE
ncbi:MAG: Hsp20/alpha crystallin family protein [Candidatus Sulfobium sp.]|jgi:HSP20 family protein